MRFENKNAVLTIATVFILLFICSPLLQANADEARQINPRIVGGGPAAPGAWPWQTGLFSSSTSSPADNVFCGGAYLGGVWVVTAAHCLVDETAADIRVVIGRQNLDGSDGDIRDVIQIVRHPNYDNDTLESDIALLRISAPSSQAPINLPKGSISAGFVSGLDATVVGWGELSEDGPTTNVLQEVVLPLVDQEICEATYSDLSENMICAAGGPNGGVDSCQGDSGGPLMANFGGLWYLAGIVSFGEGCALPDTPGVYTRVSNFLSWIEENTAISTPGTCDPIDVNESEAPLEHSPPSIPGGDSDQDGARNGVEFSVGSNRFDRGSVLPRVDVDNYGAGFWTGFLQVINILELVNKTDETVEAGIILYKIDGTTCNRLTLEIPPKGQRDVILNDLPGYEQDSYGMVTVAGGVEGRVTYYRPVSSGNIGLYDFAFSLPLHYATFGSSSVGFNTYQPSLDPTEAGNLVTNWLSIINQDTSEKTFTVNTYNNDGVLVAERTVTVGPRGRIDLDGGHGLLGPSNFGKHDVVPEDNRAPYFAFLIRYGNNAPAGVTPSGFEFATILQANPGNGERQIATVTTTVGAQNWLEVINTTDETQEDVGIEFRTSAGLIASQQKITIPPHGQTHINVNEFLGDDALGFAKITPVSTNSIVAQSMVYIRDGSGSLNTVYASQAKQAFGTSSGSFSSGSYNLYLSMFSWLKVINPNFVSTTVQLDLVHPDGTTNNVVIGVPANSSIDLGLHEAANYGTAPDTFGIVSAVAEDPVIVETVRLRIDPVTGSLDYIFPTANR